jgi:hypothetical protein
MRWWHGNEVVVWQRGGDVAVAMRQRCGATAGSRDVAVALHVTVGRP